MNAHTPIADAAPPLDQLGKLAQLRAEFEPRHISKLPKETKDQAEQRRSNGRVHGIRCTECDGWHHKDAVHLDYVGHAALTHRLLDVDPFWTWEPVAFTPHGLPAFDPTGGLWIRLTVCGVTRLGYGHAAAKNGQDPGAREKECIGDALRNAAMRFGAALDLWHKGDLHGPAEGDAAADQVNAEELATRHLRSCAVDRATFTEAWNKNKAGWRGVLDDAAWGRVVAERDRLAKQIGEAEKAASRSQGRSKAVDTLRTGGAADDSPFQGEPEHFPRASDDEIPF